MEDAVEGGPPPVLARQREHSPEVVEGDVALWEGALQSGFLEGGPLLLQGPGTTQIPLCQTYWVISDLHECHFNISTVYVSFIACIYLHILYVLSINPIMLILHTVVGRTVVFRHHV